MRVLLATDGSECAGVARDLVAAVAWPPGSTIRVVTVVEPLGVVEEELRRYGEEVLEEAVRGVAHGGHAVERAVLRGRPASAIVEDAREWSADLIVAGSRGRGEIRSMLLGSVAGEVVDHAPCPVLVARRPLLARVVLAHDGSEHALAAEELLRAWPIFGSVAVEVVSVAQQTGPWHLPPSATLYAPSVPDYFETYREIVREHTAIAEEAAARLRGGRLRAAAVVVEGDPAQQVVRVADERQADLIVLGTHGRTGLGRLLLGSVARNVMVHAPVSVLIVRPVPAHPH